MVSCAWCGSTAGSQPPTWSVSVENGVTRHYCEACTRAHVRSIEGRLDPSWW